MKRANTSLLLIIAVLFLALAGYLGVYAWQALAQPDGTALCLRGEEEFSISLTGIILREEQVLVSQGSWVSITAREGRRVGAGDELGISCSSQGDLQRALRLRQLQRELELVQAVLDGPDSGLDPMSAARDAGQAAQELAACLARGEFGSLRAGALALRTLTLESGPEAARAEETALREELAMLEADGPARPRCSPPRPAACSPPCWTAGKTCLPLCWRALPSTFWIRGWPSRPPGPRAPAAAWSPATYGTLPPGLPSRMPRPWNRGIR